MTSNFCFLSEIIYVDNFKIAIELLDFPILLQMYYKNIGVELNNGGLVVANYGSRAMS